MDFFLYSNKNALFNYLSRNLIAGNSIVPEIKGCRTISTQCEHFLFVTHKCLSRASRILGIPSPQEVHPVTLKLDVTTEFLGDCRIVLVKKTEESYKCFRGNWSNYNREEHIGAFIIGTLPLSCVDKYLFDDENERDSFYRPSPDYWYPQNKFGVLPVAEFNEELAVNISEDDLLQQTNLDVKDITSRIRSLEKRQAALLLFVHATQTWRYGKYRLNMDHFLQEILEIHDDDIVKSIPKYATIKSIDNNETLSLLSVIAADKNEKSLNQRLYDCIFDLFSAEIFNKPHPREYFFDCFERIENIVGTETPNASAISKSLSYIRSLIDGNSKELVEDIIISIPGSADVLKAVLFVARDPNDFDHFMTSLKKYRLDVVSARRACVLWGALNGLRGTPGEGFNKDNQIMWQFVEWYTARNISDNEFSFVTRKPIVFSPPNEVLGISLWSEEDLSFEDIYAQINGHEFKFSEEDYKKIVKAAQKKLGRKKFDDDYMQLIASFNYPTIKIGDPIPSEVTSDVLKANKSPKLNKEKLLHDWIESKPNCEFTVNESFDYWKTRCLKLQGEKHGYA